MGKPKECANCKKPATIHLTQIVNNQIKKLDFCESCPYQKGITDPQGISLAELLAQGPSPLVDAGGGSPVATMQCKSCGLTPLDFKKHHRLGCPDCYSELSDFVTPMLVNLQRDQIHHGKTPRRMLARMEHQREVARLDKALQEAIAEEHFEEAARLRDLLLDVRARQKAEKNEADL
jgi:protein arginine kinase activator